MTFAERTTDLNTPSQYRGTVFIAGTRMLIDPNSSYAQDVFSFIAGTDIHTVVFASTQSSEAAHQLLRPLFELQTHRTNVSYRVNGDTILSKSYGIQDNSRYTGFAEVHCGVTEDARVREELVAVLAERLEDEQLYVIRPDVQTEQGYSIQSLMANQSAG